MMPTREELMPNTELLERVLQHITDHPEAHDQTTWARPDPDCGTAACFAGWTCSLAGYQLVPSHNWAAQVIVNGERRSIKHTATELLDLEPAQARTLFAGGNTLVHLQMMVKDLVNGEQLRETEAYWEEARG